MAAFQQPFGLPAGNQPGLDQVIGDPIGVGQGGLAASFCVSSASAASSWSLSTNPLRRTRSEKSIDVWFGHACPAIFRPDPSRLIRRRGLRPGTAAATPICRSYAAARLIASGLTTS